MAITAEQRLAWWHEARFGLFIHWGLYAIPAGEWKGVRVKGIGEWIMRDQKIPIEEYEQLAKDFNPVKFDADEWVQLAHDAGMKYLVITAKHHDGFCMFDCPTNPYNIVAQTPFKRDPMKELADACAKRGIRMCFYYSQAQDWHAPGGAGHWEEASNDGGPWLKYTRPPEDFQKYLDDIVKPDLRQLLTNYGPIGLIWFDTPVAITKEQSESLRDFVHELQPECLVSGRVGHGVGDYGSLGDNQHPVGPVQGAWETPATLNDTWGFKHFDHNWKSLDDLIDLLVNCASKGVNYLLNVGPTAEGIIPQPSVDLLRQVGDWLKRNGDAIYGTKATPFIVDPAWGRVTTKGSTIYLLVKKWSSEIKVLGLKNGVKSAGVLGQPHARVEVKQDGDVTTFDLPAQAPEPTVSVVAVELDGAPDVEHIVIQDGGSVSLPVHTAQLAGDIKVDRGGFIEGWKDNSPSATFTFRIKTPGTYAVSSIARVNRKRLDEAHGTPTIAAEIAGAQMQATVSYERIDQSEGAKVFQESKTTLGTVALNQPGEYTLKLTADGFPAELERGLMLISVELDPA